MKAENMLLVGDIGGTKTNLALVSAGRGLEFPLAEATFPSRQYPSLEAMVHAFLAGADWVVKAACFGVAGPVVGGRAVTTNLPWIVDERELEVALGLSSVYLLNDLDAIAQAVPRLQADDLETLHSGEPTPNGPIAVLAPGTGLGQAFLTWGPEGYQSHPSEGGHVDFAPTDALQSEMLRYLWRRFEHVSYELVCSGRGLPNIYAFLKESGYAREPDWLAEELAGAADPTPIIVGAALEGKRPCELCQKTLDLFISILGAKAGNLALQVMATGGVYLGGGIPPKILPALRDGRLLKSFVGKGRFSDLLARVPIHVILNPKAALLGAAWHGFELMF